MRSSLLTIGDELLIGQVQDTNAVWLSEKLYLLGAPVEKKITVGDNKNDISKAIKLLLGEQNIIVITGGLGPTQDDVTTSALAEAMGRKLVFNQEMFNRLKRIFSMRNIPMTMAHNNQCYLPEGAVLLKNDWGTAPGMWFEKDKSIIIALPGIPREMRGIMEHVVLPRLSLSIRPDFKYLTIHTSGCPESTLAESIDPVLDQLKPDLEIAYLPSIGEVRLRLSARGSNIRSADELVELGKNLVLREIGRHVYGYDGTSLAETIGDELRKRNLTISTAESCTGGYLAHKITSVPGASDYFLGGAVVYSNQMKQDQLGISRSTLDFHGAVSDPVVREMVAGVIRLTSSDIGIAISGIAGPGGGTKDKPVGTVWIGVGNKTTIVTTHFLFGKDRIHNIELAGSYALTLLRRFLIEQ